MTVPQQPGRFDTSRPMTLLTFRKYVEEVLIPQTYHQWETKRIRFVEEPDHAFQPDFHVTKSRLDRYGSWTHFVWCAYQHEVTTAELAQIGDYLQEHPQVRAGTIFTAAGTTVQAGAKDLVDEHGLRLVATAVPL